MDVFISIFDIIGPQIIGPSSSHTAGAAKMGYAAFELLSEKPESIHIQLFNSFTDTGKGHKTDRAVLGGCLGFSPSDERIRDSYEIAQKEKIPVNMEWGHHDSKYHPNTAKITLTKGTNKVEVIGYSIGGGRIELASVKQNGRIQKEFKPYTGGLSTPASYYTWEAIKTMAKNSAEVIEVAVETEAQCSGSNPSKFWLEVDELWQTMKIAASKSIESTKLSETKLTGGDAHRLLLNSPQLVNQFSHDAIMYGLGIAEHNAKMGKVVACPTAGSCGIVPGILYALYKHHNYSDTEIAKSLVIAGVIGMVTARQVDLAGAVAGCQAEIGVAGAMAAGAAMYLQNGNLKHIESAASLVLANVLGLTCDPVMGLVEIPCVARNGVVISLTLGALEMALAGIKYKIPYDEIVTVMKHVGDDMATQYKETSLGGLAKTPWACQKCVQPCR